MNLDEKIESLKEFLKDKKCVLGFSAGSDSTVLAYILSEVSPQSLLVTIDNTMMPEGFIEFTESQAKLFGLEHEVITLNFYEDPEFLQNKQNRCYECRKKMYSNIQKLPQFSDYEYFIEGTNITDLLEDRPGILVKEMFNMTSPLIECGITKEDVYNIIKKYDLEYSSNTTCLATRIKTGQHINREKIEIINKSEELLRKQVTQDNMRVRFDNYTAIITVDNPLEILDKEKIEYLRGRLQEYGFTKVLIDITGYKKTRLTYKIDENRNYYYQIPYTINLEKTREKIDHNKKLTKKAKLDKNIYYDDITIEENGKISMPPTKDFENKFLEIIQTIERKNI